MMKVKVIRVDGAEEEHKLEDHDFAGIERLIDAQGLDHFSLRKTGQIVWVDDIGFWRKKPINPKATLLYHSTCRQGTTQPIVGDVAITDDGGSE